MTSVLHSITHVPSWNSSYVATTAFHGRAWTMLSGESSLTCSQ